MPWLQALPRLHQLETETRGLHLLRSVGNQEAGAWWCGGTEMGPLPRSALLKAARRVSGRDTPSSLLEMG